MVKDIEEKFKQENNARYMKARRFEWFTLGPRNRGRLMRKSMKITI